MNLGNLFTNTPKDKPLTPPTLAVTVPIADKPTIIIHNRPVICKVCGHKFNSDDTKTTVCCDDNTRVEAPCNECGSINKIKKVLSFPENTNIY